MLNSQHNLDNGLYYLSSMGAGAKINPNYLEDIQNLLAMGADVNCQIEEEGYHSTPLHTAQNAKIARVLLSHGARLDVCDSEGRTPYERHQYIAQFWDIQHISKAHKEICDLILEEQSQRDRATISKAIGFTPTRERAGARRKM